MKYALTPTLSAASLALALAGLGTAENTQAQPNRAKVLQATPIYEQVAIPVEDCVDYIRHTRCTTATHYEDQLLGYDVVYEYQGQHHTQRMPDDPGPYLSIEPAAASGVYGSAPLASTSSAIPGRKSYGSAAPGAPAVQSIQYHGQDISELPVQINVLPGLTPPPHRPRH